MPTKLLLSIARFAAIIMFVGALAALPVGCSEEKPPEEEEKPAAPPPPTADQLYGEMANAFKPIVDATIPGAPMAFVEGHMQNFKQVYSKVNGQRATNAENVEPAITRTKALVEDNIKLAKARDRWRFIYGSIVCFETLDPANTKYNELKKLAETMMKMPGVKLKGFMQLPGDESPYASFDVFDQETRKLENYRVREGEEFHNGRFLFVSIDGNQMGANLIYKDADFEFRVGGPRERNTTRQEEEPELN